MKWPRKRCRPCCPSCEMIEEGAKDGLRDSPDPLTVTIRAAHFWYVAAQRHTGGHE